MYDIWLLSYMVFSEYIEKVHWPWSVLLRSVVWLLSSIVDCSDVLHMSHARQPRVFFRLVAVKWRLINPPCMAFRGSKSLSNSGWSYSLVCLSGYKYESNPRATFGGLGPRSEITNGALDAKKKRLFCEKINEKSFKNCLKNARSARS